MRYLYRTTQKLPRYAAKAVLLVVLLFELFLPIGQVLSTPVAQAQVTANASASAGVNAPKNCTITIYGDTGGYGATTQTVAANADGTCPTGYSTNGGTLVQDANGKTVEPKIECNWSPNTWDICLSNVVYVFTVGLGSGLAYVGSYFFDMTVRLSLDSASYALDFLSSGWTAARDLANMAFMLILVYIAFVVMFQAETTGTIQTLAWVVFIALIINFQLLSDARGGRHRQHIGGAVL
jgi:hypothetical protein